MWVKGRHIEKRQLKLTLYGCVVVECCVGFASLDEFLMNFMIVPVLYSSFLISVCMFIVSNNCLYEVLLFMSLYGFGM